MIFMSVSAISINPKIQGGVPCFTGTRVPVSSLFDHLEEGYTLNEFLSDFPTVKREQTIAALELAKADMARHVDRRGDETAA